MKKKWICTVCGLSLIHILNTEKTGDNSRRAIGYRRFSQYLCRLAVVRDS